VFGRKQETTQGQVEVTDDDGLTVSRKGKPTPKRKEAEAARRQRMAPPKDRREAKARLRSERNKERQQAMDAMASGNEKNYPVRDQGRSRHIARNWVDGRRNVGEYLWPVIITALVLIVIPIPAIQQYSMAVLLAFYALLTADLAWSLLGLRKALAIEVPDAGERRGALPYTLGRSMQSRKRRKPIPRVEPGWTRRYTKGQEKAVVS
jgi:hypothetical protein